MTGEKIYIEAGSGELIDKITILEIKLARIEDPQKLKNIRYELETLAATRDRALPSSDKLAQLTSALKSVNETLWDIEMIFAAAKRKRISASALLNWRGRFTNQ